MLQEPYHVGCLVLVHMEAALSLELPRDDLLFLEFGEGQILATQFLGLKSLAQDFLVLAADSGLQLLDQLLVGRAGHVAVA